MCGHSSILVTQTSEKIDFEHELALRLLQLQTPTQISCAEECLFQQQPAQFGQFVCKKYQARLLITADQLLLVHNFASSGQRC